MGCQTEDSLKPSSVDMYQRNSSKLMIKLEHSLIINALLWLYYQCWSAQDSRPCTVYI